MEWLSPLPPVLALGLAIVTRNVYWALGLAIWLSETLLAGGHPGLGFLASIDRAVGVFQSEGNTRILLFCLIIGALIAFMQASGGITGMVEKLYRSGLASTPRRAGLISAVSGLIIFVETNVSLLASGVLGRPLFDRLQLSRARLAYIIDSTCAPVSVLVLLNGWGAYIAGLLASQGVESPFSTMFQTIGLNFYPLLTLLGVFLTIFIGRTIGPMAQLEAALSASAVKDNDKEPDSRLEPSGSASPDRALYMLIPLFILIAGALAFMVWTGEGDIRRGSGSASILYAVILATSVAFICLLLSRRASGQAVETGFRGMADLLPAVTIILLAFILGDSLQALGTGTFIASSSSAIPAPFLLPAFLFLAAGLTSFATGTSWGTYGIFIPIAVPLAIGTGLPLPLIIAAVMGGGVFGDHCSPISDTTIIASLAAGCDHMEHVRTQLPYALVAGLSALIMYLVAGLLV